MEPLSRTAVEERPGRRRLEAELRLHQRVLDRDRTALLEWLRLVGDVVYCAALSRTGRPAEAERLTEALFLEVWRHPAMFDPAEGPLALQLIRRMNMPVVAAA